MRSKYRYVVNGLVALLLVILAAIAAHVYGGFLDSVLPAGELIDRYNENSRPFDFILGFSIASIIAYFIIQPLWIAFDQIKSDKRQSDEEAAINEKKLEELESNLAKMDTDSRSVKDELVLVQKDYKSLESALERERKKQGVDLLTGLPNQLAFVSDLAAATGSEGARTIAVIFIDICGLKRVNEEKGYRTGSIYIREIAQDIHRVMRRDEDLYRHRNLAISADGDPRESIYRKYTGGDEFLFIIPAGEAVALRFIRRIFTSIKRKEGRYRKLVDMPDFDVKFHAGIYQLGSLEENIDSVMDNVETALNHARNQDLPECYSEFVVCHSLFSSGEVSDDDKQVLEDIDLVLRDADFRWQDRF